MNTLINFDDVNNRIISIRNQDVILDSAVAELYGVETKRVNEAIKNNPDKFPEGYVFELSLEEKQQIITNGANLKYRPSVTKDLITDTQIGVVEIFDHPEYTPFMAYLEKIKLSPTLPKAFTEKGLYMLATILKSPQATQTTISIVEAFAKLKQLSNNIAALNSMETEVVEPEVLESTGSLLDELLFSGLPTSAETSFEVNLGIMKAKRIIKSENPAHQSEFEELKKMIAKINERLGI